MKRKEFLKKLGLGMIGAVVGAKVATELVKEPVQVIDMVDLPKYYFNVQRIKNRQEFLRKYPYTEEQAFHRWEHVDHNYLGAQMKNDFKISKEMFEESLRNIKNGPQRLVTNAPVEWTPLNKYHGRTKKNKLF